MKIASAQKQRISYHERVRRSRRWVEDGGREEFGEVECAERDDVNRPLHRHLEGFVRPIAEDPFRQHPQMHERQLQAQYDVHSENRP